MGSLRVVTILLLLGSPAFAQSPTYGVGRTPTAEEIRRMDISIGPTGLEHPVGCGTNIAGAQVCVQKACIGCHGAAAKGWFFLIWHSSNDSGFPVWKKERILPLRA